MSIEFNKIEPLVEQVLQLRDAIYTLYNISEQRKDNNLTERVKVYLQLSDKQLILLEKITKTDLSEEEINSSVRQIGSISQLIKFDAESLLEPPINEELLGGVINFFKGLWTKAMEELKKLGEDPDTTEVKDWIADNPFNPADNNYLFKNVMDEFKKKPEANDQDALTLVDSILNPETGVLGKQGLAPLYENLFKNLALNNSPEYLLSGFREKYLPLLIVLLILR